MNDHIGELAALYALGALDDPERREVEAHIDRCDACVRLLAQAQDDVTAIALAQPQHAPPPELAARIAGITGKSTAVTPLPVRRRAPSWMAAVAAAVVIALLPSIYFVNQNIAMHQAMVAEADAMARISSSPHRNVAFTGADAHVMYGPDGSWYCVIVRGVTRPLHVVWPHDGEKEMLGTAMPHGDVALLYLPKSKRMDQLALMDGEQVVASAQLAFQ